MYFSPRYVIPKCYKVCQGLWRHFKVVTSTFVWTKNQHFPPLHGYKIHVFFSWLQECIPVGCVPPACWLYPIVSHVSRGGGSAPHPDSDPLWMQPPLDANPQRQTPLPTDATPPPRCRPPGHVTCDACWEANRPPPSGQTNTCENITLPKISFTGSNKSNDKKLVPPGWQMTRQDVHDDLHN